MKQVKQERTEWYYSLEATFHEYLMRSAHRTTDPVRLYRMLRATSYHAM
jgi:hypothetical protein